MMQLINTAYEDFTKYFMDHADYTVREATECDAEHNIDIEFINKLKAMQGVIIEIIGYWVWLAGDTFTHKDAIKGLGFKFSGDKKRWYWASNLSDKKKRGSSSLKTIRNKFGSVIVTSEPRAMLSA
jgi:hypothetical protein